MTRDVLFNFRLSAEERDAFRDAAERCGMSAAAWLREVGLAAAGESEMLRALKRAERRGRHLRAVEDEHG